MERTKLENLLKPLIRIYDSIELEIIENMIQKIDNYDDVKGTLKWYNDKLLELGTFDKDNKKIIKKNKKAIKKALEELIEKGSRQIEYKDLLDDYYSKGLLEKNPIELFGSVAFNNVVNNALKDTDNILNLINTKVLEGSDKAYNFILSKAYIETSSGVYSYQQSIKNAIKEFSEMGIKTVHYESGKSIGIEAVVRRDVLTRVNKLVGDIDIENAKELGTNLIFVYAHKGARVRTPYMKNDYEAHAEWQGKVYMIEGSNNQYDNLYEKTGLNEMLGLKGINCRHEIRPFFDFEEMPKNISFEENEEAYKLQQKQRAFERKERQIKRELEAFKIVDKEEYKKQQERLNVFNKKYDKWLKENNMKRDYAREYVN